MRRGWILLLLWMALPLLAQFAQEEAPVPPLLAVLNGEIFRVQDDALQPYPACQPEERLSNQIRVGTSGDYLMLATIPPLVDAALTELGSLGGVPYGLNIWLCDLRAETLERIYAIPGGDAAFTGEAPALDVVNSRPVWSPEGNTLAWASLDAQTEAQTIFFYNAESGEQEALPLNAPLPFGFFAPPELRWAGDSIFFTVSTLDEETFLDEERLFVFDPQEGELTGEGLLTAGGEQDDFIVERLPITGPEGEGYLALRYFSAGWLLADAAAGELEALPGLPEYYSPLAPQGLSLLLDIDQSYSYNWDIRGVDEALALNGYPVERISIAPDGQAIAYADSTLKVLSADGRLREIAGSEAFADDFAARILWSPAAWRVPVAAAPIIEQDRPGCAGTLPPRLGDGDQGRVINPETAMNVRSEPNLSGVRIGQLPGGAAFVVIAEPTCADGFVWVQVRYEGIEGWVAESGEEYFLEPAQP